MKTLPAELSQSVKDRTIRRDLRAAIGPHHKQRCAGQLACEMQKQQERGWVGPMEVVKSHKEPALGSGTRGAQQNLAESLEETVALQLGFGRLGWRRLD